MKICITCVYWTLLFISVASSALLFIIVACENAQTNYYLPLKNNETTETYDNDTLDRIEDNSIETSNIPLARLKNSKKLDARYDDRYYQVRTRENKKKFAKKAVDFESVIKSKTRRKENPYKDPDIVAESLTQQPNLSQGVSESEQATVLTLVDTTVAELQSLAEPKLNAEFSRTRSFIKNSSLLTKNANLGQTIKEEQEEISPSTQTPSPPGIDETKGSLNETDILQDESLLLSKSVKEDVPEVVVVVRAEQGPITTDELGFKQEDDVKVLPDEVPKIDGTFATTPELSDAEAKARLVGDNRDEAATVVFGEGIVSVGSTNPHEDIPSFSEWTQKRLEEAEKKKTAHPNASVQNAGTPTRGVGGMKVRSKNYASPDCGAKIVAANPEARSARSVLVSTRDEYMLNTCTSRIWFVVELCEAIQAKKIELANFELFSSSPKDFSVYISDRFPTRDWSPVGQFTAKDTKDIQSFPLQPHLFGKFIKIELHTYYGSEHFCPVSLFRAYGTSEFEVLETETEISRETNTDDDDEEDSDEEEVLDAENGEPPRNLFGSARDAVLSIMKKAAEVLVKSSELTGNNITKIQQSIDSGNILENSFVSCTTPRYTILCDNCSDQKFAKIFQLVSCREKQLNELLKIDLVNRTLRQSGLCKAHGVGVETFETREVEQLGEKVKDAEKEDSTKNFQLTFVTSIFNSEYIAALCNVLAIKERKMVMNTSHEMPFNNFKDAVKEDVPDKHKEDHSEDGIKSFQHASITCTSSLNTDTLKLESSKVFQQNTQELLNKEVKLTEAPIEIFLSTENVASQINPSKTKTKHSEKEEAKNDSSILISEFNNGSVEETVQADVLTTVSVSSNDVEHSVLKASEKPLTTPGISIENSAQVTVSVPLAATDNNELPNDDIGPDIESLEFVGMQNKAEHFVQEGKQGETESNLEQDVKLTPQDPLIDTLLSDLKDLEGETPHVPNEPAASASVIQLATNTMPQKESVFLRLSNRIKALERNMSLSGQYLEELSRRYKKQVEEMQKSLERTVSAMNEETRKREERESKRAEEIAVLREELSNLSNSMKNLLYDRDSWRGKISMICQHILIMCSEVFVIYLFVLYCRRSNSKRSHTKENQQKEPARRKSAENFGSHTRKMKKRRPSEIASQITGTYRELMINDKSQEAKKEKKKKRKKGTVIINHRTNNEAETSLTTQSRTSLTDNAEIPSNGVSSYETLQIDDSQKQIFGRLKSTAENTDCSNNAVCQAQLTTALSKDNFETGSVKSSELSNSSNLDHSNESNSLLTNVIFKPVPLSEQAINESSADVLNSKNSSVILKDVKLSVPSSFVRSAWSSRKKRKVNVNDTNGQWNRNFNDSDGKLAETSSAVLKIHTDSDPTPTNGLSLDQSDQSTSSSVTSMSKKRDKKGSSFRKMVRKFF